VIELVQHVDGVCQDCVKGQTVRRLNHSAPRMWTHPSFRQTLRRYDTIEEINVDAIQVSCLPGEGCIIYGLTRRGLVGYNSKFGYDD